MAYLVLARKWRPQIFEDVAGQEHITNTLQRALERGRIAHAYLFTGPRGVGKTTTARILAKSLNCKKFDKPTPRPCNECQSCVEITDGRSADVLEIDGASNRGVEDARRLREHVQYAPHGRYKVIIVDEVHMLTTEAFNALLKTLEEPPPQVVFIFATTEPHKVLPTIQSRCQRFDFRRISQKTIEERITKIAQTEGFDLGKDAAQLITFRSDGSMRDALSMLDQILAYEPQTQIKSDEVAKILGIVPLESFRKIADTVGLKKPEKALTELANLLDSGFDPLQILSGLIEHFRSTVLAKIGALSSEVYNAQVYLEIAKSRKLEDFLRILKILSENFWKMKTSEFPRYILEQLLIYLALMDEVVTIQDILMGIEKKSIDVVSDRPTVVKSSESIGEELSPTTHQEEGFILEEDLGESPPEQTKERFLYFLEKHRPGLAISLRDAEIERENNQLLIRFPSSLESVREATVASSSAMEAIQRSAEESFGPQVVVQILSELLTTKTTPQQESSVPNDVSKILSLFDAKLE